MIAIALKNFREFANGIRQPASYCPVVTELKGITNIGLGSMEFLTGQCMKYSNDGYLNGLSRRHVQMGKETLSVGFKQFIPGCLVGISAAYLVGKMISPHNASPYEPI